MGKRHRGIKKGGGTYLNKGGERVEGNRQYTYHRGFTRIKDRCVSAKRNITRVRWTKGGGKWTGSKILDKKREKKLLT